MACPSRNTPSSAASSPKLDPLGAASAKARAEPTERQHAPQFTAGSSHQERGAAAARGLGRQEAQTSTATGWILGQGGASQGTSPPSGHPVGPPHVAIGQLNHGEVTRAQALRSHPEVGRGHPQLPKARQRERSQEAGAGPGLGRGAGGARPQILSLAAGV